MAFNLEAVKTVLEDALNAAETRIGPWLGDIKSAVHAVVEAVHRQALADEQAAQGAVVGAVKTVETQITADVDTAKHALDTTTAPAVSAEPGAESGTA